MANDRWLEDVWPRFGTNHAAYDALTFRELPIVLAAQNDSMLEHLLRKRLVDDADVLKEVLGTNGPLGGSKNRRDVAYLLGIIEEEPHRIFGITSKIRNHFAHVATASSSDQTVRDQIKNLVPPFVDYARKIGYVESTPGFEDMIADQLRRSRDSDEAAGGLLIGANLLVQIVLNAFEPRVTRLKGAYGIYNGIKMAFSEPPTG